MWNPMPSYTQIQGEEQPQSEIDKKRFNVKFSAQINEKVHSLADIIYYAAVLRSETYNYRKDGKLSAFNPQCPGGKRRSSDDIYRIAKSFIPGITLQRVKNELAKAVKGGAIANVFCPKIQMTTHCTGGVNIKPTDIKRFVKI